MYGHLVAKRGPNQLDAGQPVPLADVYELMTLMPGVAREYSRQEFARDIYLLDRGGVDDPARLRQLPGQHGRAIGAAMRVVTESGQEKVYYGLAFSPGG